MLNAARWLGGTLCGMAIVVAAISVSHDASAVPAAHRARLGRTDRPHVESFEPLAVDTLNDRIALAARAGEAWTRDPMRVALEVTGGSPLSARTLDIHCEGNSGEAPDSAEVTIVGDGYADDSVRGSWSLLRLARQADASWRVLELRRAWRCWRGHHLASYSKQLCP